MAKKSKERENDELISPLVPTKRRKNTNRDTTNSDVCFVGKPLSAAEATDRWPHRYQSKVASPFPLSLLPSLLSKSSFFLFFLMCCFLFLIQRVEVAGSKEEWVSFFVKKILNDLMGLCYGFKQFLVGDIGVGIQRVKRRRFCKQDATILKLW